MKDYKYNHIPFCTQCNKHSEFTATTTNQIRGAVTMDNPGGLDPTFVATKQTTNLICNTCGQKMNYLKDFMSSWADATDYSRQFFTDSQVKKAQEIEEAGWSVGMFRFLILFSAAPVLLVYYLAGFHDYDV